MLKVTKSDQNLASQKVTFRVKWQNCLKCDLLLPLDLWPLSKAPYFPSQGEHPKLGPKPPKWSWSSPRWSHSPQRHEIKKALVGLFWGKVTRAFNLQRRVVSVRVSQFVPHCQRDLGSCPLMFSLGQSLLPCPPSQQSAWSSFPSGGLHLGFMCAPSLSCLTLCDPMYGSLPGSSVHGIFQARKMEWVAISFSSGPFWPESRDWASPALVAGSSPRARWEPSFGSLILVLLPEDLCSVLHLLLSLFPAVEYF